VCISTAFEPKPWRIKSSQTKAIQCAHGPMDGLSALQQDADKLAVSAIVADIFGAVVRRNDEGALALSSAMQNANKDPSRPATGTAAKSLQHDSNPPPKTQEHIPSFKTAARSASLPCEDKPTSRRSMPSSCGSKCSPNPKLTPIQPLLRVAGPVAPFQPGLDVPPEQWPQRERRKANALVQRNPASEFTLFQRSCKGLVIPHSYNNVARGT